MLWIKVALGRKLRESLVFHNAGMGASWAGIALRSPRLRDLRFFLVEIKGISRSSRRTAAENAEGRRGFRVRCSGIIEISFHDQRQTHRGGYARLQRGEDP